MLVWMSIIVGCTLCMCGWRWVKIQALYCEKIDVRFWWWWCWCFAYRYESNLNPCFSLTLVQIGDDAIEPIDFYFLITLVALIEYRRTGLHSQMDELYWGDGGVGAFATTISISITFVLYWEFSVVWMQCSSRQNVSIAQLFRGKCSFFNTCFLAVMLHTIWPVSIDVDDDRRWTKFLNNSI